jgi:hypothetical protein
MLSTSGLRNRLEEIKVALVHSGTIPEKKMAYSNMYVYCVNMIRDGLMIQV